MEAQVADGPKTRFDTDNTVTTRKQPKQQLSKAMEHMRFAVTADPIPHPPTTTASSTPPPSTPPIAPSEGTTPDSDAYGVPSTIQPLRNNLTHRSHSPSNNQKRTDPFAFGSRLLLEGDDIFEFNAWDHVSVDPSYAAFSEAQYSKQRSDPVSDFDRARFDANPEKWWNLFYRNNKTNFFKNRKWLAQEFPVLADVCAEDAPAAVVLEVGAGAGNSAFPILQRNANKRLKIHACDFSKKAVELIRGHELYDPQHIQADVWDVAASPDSEHGGLPPGLQAGSVDVVLMIFIFSALNPAQWDQAVRNVWRVLKPGGQVLFRDYGRGDLAQVRFKKGRYMQENFYVRGDGTRVYFFEKDELEQIWSGRSTRMDRGAEAEGGGQDAADSPSSAQHASQSPATATPPSEAPSLQSMPRSDSLPQSQVPPPSAPSLAPNDTAPSPSPPCLQLQSSRQTFQTADIGVDRRMLVNRQRRLKMYRCWLQAVFRKPGEESEVVVRRMKAGAREVGEREEGEEEVGEVGTGGVDDGAVGGERGDGEDG